MRTVHVNGILLAYEEQEKEENETNNYDTK